MAGALRCLCRSTLPLSVRITAKRKSRFPDWRVPASQYRGFSSAPSWLADDTNPFAHNLPITVRAEDPRPKRAPITIEDLPPEDRAEFDRSSPEDQDSVRSALQSLSEANDPAAMVASWFDEATPDDAEIEQELDEIDREAPIVFPERKLQKSEIGYWAEDEEDDEFTQVPDDDDDFLADDITTPAHSQLDLHRDMREYQRRIAWDMPLLRKFAKPFHPPPLTSPLRFRYTTYMGEEHPASRKIVLEFCPADLPSLTPAQVNKLIKLAGIRYNPDRRAIKMSCEKFDNPAQNKRYLGDVVQGLIAEATDPTKDSFEDMPFDFRHHKPKKVLRFPDEWALGSPEKVRELVRGREERRLLAEGTGEGALVDGEQVVREYVHAAMAFQATEAERTAPLVRGGRGRQMLRR